MATYIQLAAEPWWNAEFESPALDTFNRRLRQHFGHTKDQTGSKGDNNHLRGRHRSRNWDLNSIYCTDRSYATTDQRDKTGDGDWLRATDVGITGATLRTVCARLDAAVRGGKLPFLAEWFGTIDGTHVVGWFEGHSSTSDSSHLYHLHLGYWTSRCNDVVQYRLLGDIITGQQEDAFMALSADDQQALIWRVHALVNNLPAVAGGPTKGEINELAVELTAIRRAIEQGGPGAEAILAGTQAQIDQLLTNLTSELRDAIADLGEGGATQVRADA